MVPPSTSTPVPPRSRSCIVLGKRKSAGASEPDEVRTTCRTCCSVPRCSGSAGTASTPVPRARPTAPPVWPSPRPRGATCAGADPGLARSSSRSATVKPDDRGCGVRCGCRPGRHHPGLRLTCQPDRRHLAIGFIAGIALRRWPIGLKYKFGFDDSLDVVGVHLVGGLWGTMLDRLLRLRPRRPGRLRGGQARSSSTAATYKLLLVQVVAALQRIRLLVRDRPSSWARSSRSWVGFLRVSEDDRGTSGHRRGCNTRRAAYTLSSTLGGWQPVGYGGGGEPLGDSVRHVQGSRDRR